MSSGSPRTRSRSFDFCVATPTGQLFVWQTRAMTQPAATMATVPKPNSSAPRSASLTTSMPVRTPPSARTVTPSRSPFSTSVLCTSASPSSRGPPACLMDEMAAAPEPPSWPLTWMTSAPALATPQATVPMPMMDTSLTEMRAVGLMALRSKMSCVRSSME